MEEKEERIKKIYELENKLYSEDKELFEKIIKLEVQFQAMRTYHQTLRARINDFQQEIFKINEQN